MAATIPNLEVKLGASAIAWKWGKRVDLESEQQQHGAWKVNAVRAMAAAKCQHGSDREMKLGKGRRKDSFRHSRRNVHVHGTEQQLVIRRASRWLHENARVDTQEGLGRYTAN